MIKQDVIIVGGGPAGSTCAWQLRRQGASCLVLDQHPFPRFKPCAGWVTPELIFDLELDSADYPYSFTTFHSFEIAIRGFQFRMRTLQHAIRRYEFDNFLLQRSGAPVVNHTVHKITPHEDGFDVDGEYFAKHLVGAGGTHCPVSRQVFGLEETRPKGSLIVAQEEEFQYPYSDPRCYLWFLQNNLPGYAWYVPKSNGYVNVGVGGKAEQLKANGDSLRNHWNILVKKLTELGLVRNHDYAPSGHSYYLRHNTGEVQRGTAYRIGDSIGLATLDMGEGIHPAVESGLRAANAILTGSDYSVRGIHRYSFVSMVLSGFRRETGK